MRGHGGERSRRPWAQTAAVGQFWRRRFGHIDLSRSEMRPSSRLTVDVYIDHHLCTTLIIAAHDAARRRRR